MLDIEIERDDVGWVMRIDRGSNGCLGGGVALCCLLFYGGFREIS
jgi:hypothetical protein